MYAELMNENVRIRAENVLLRKVVFALERAAKAESDVSDLVEVLERVRDRLESERRSGEFDPLIRDIDAALAAHRKQGGSND